jgi:hypothetical protein
VRHRWILVWGRQRPAGRWLSSAAAASTAAYTVWIMDQHAAPAFGRSCEGDDIDSQRCLPPGGAFCSYSTINIPPGRLFFFQQFFFGPMEMYY